jgi:antirestriction protein ArdC
MKSDLYQSVTRLIVQQLEQGVRPWMQPWSSDHAGDRIVRPQRSNGEPYKGINVLMLWAAATTKGYHAPVWMTFKQALDLKAHVRKGEHGSLVVYADRMTRAATDRDTGEETEHSIPFLKSYTVFNVEQIEGLPERFYAKPEQPKSISGEPIDRLTHADAFFEATRAHIVHGGSRACYVLRTDNIHLPCIDFFRDAESYYATLAHEATHWTRHPSRLDRDFGRKRWGDEGYAMEELVAELGAAFLCADLALTPEVREDHAAYIASWITVLKNDTRAIFAAAAHAQRAVDFLHGGESSGAETSAVAA